MLLLVERGGGAMPIPDGDAALIIAEGGDGKPGRGKEETGVEQ